MIDEELKKIWQDAPITEKIKFNHSKKLMNMDQELKTFERKIKARDYREIGVALLLIPYFVYVAYGIDNVVSFFGCVTIILYCMWVIYKLQAVKKYKKTNMTGNLKEQLIQTHRYLSAEKALIDSVLTWYILPAFIGLALFFGGKHGLSLKFLGLMTFQFFIMLGIFWLNHRASKTYYGPIVKQLEGVIAELS